MKSRRKSKRDETGGEERMRKRIRCEKQKKEEGISVNQFYGRVLVQD